MCGRGFFCLLAASLILALQISPVVLRSQSDAGQRAHDLRVDTFTPPAQPSLPDPPHPPYRPPSTFGFTQLAQSAGIIFSGRVTAIGQLTTKQAVATLTITFHVEQAIRGVTPGEDFTISQWIGLWSSGQRYRVGERVLLFLYLPSKLGLTSCVGGPLGRFAIDPAGRVLFSAQHLSAFRTDPVLGGKSRLAFSDFAQAVRQAREEE